MKYRLEYIGFPRDASGDLSEQLKSLEFNAGSDREAIYESVFFQMHAFRIGKLFRIEMSREEVLINDEKGLKGNVIIFDQRNLIRRISAIKDRVMPALQWMQSRVHDAGLTATEMYHSKGHSENLESAIAKLDSLMQQILAKNPQTKPV